MRFINDLQFSRVGDPVFRTYQDFPDIISKGVISHIETEGLGQLNLTFRFFDIDKMQHKINTDNLYTLKFIGTMHMDDIFFSKEAAFCYLKRANDKTIDFLVQTVDERTAKKYNYLSRVNERIKEELLRP